MDANAVLSHLSDYRAAACSLQASNSALEAKVKQLETENRHLNEMLKRAKQRQALTEHNFSALIATMSPLKQRQDQILQTLKDISQSISKRSDATDNPLPVMAAVPQIGIRGPIITLPPAEHTHVLPTTEKSVCQQRTHAILTAPIDPMGPKIQEKTAISPPSSSVASPCRQEETTDTERKQNPQLKRAFVCLQPVDRSMAEAAREREEKKIKVELE